MFALHHVQLAMPPGREDDARWFYRDVVGMAEVPKPRELARRGGVWFRKALWSCHLGVEESFAPARKAHPGILVHDLDAIRARLVGSGVDVEPDGRLPGFRRFYTHDCFGNRLEFLMSVGDSAP